MSGAQSLFRRTACILICLVVAAHQARAGGTTSTARIEQVVKLGESDYRLTVSPLSHDNDSVFRGCSTVTIQSRYRRSHWWSRHGSPGSSQEHSAAIAKLQAAVQDRQPVRLGEIGEGFHRDAARPCEFISYGFRLLKEGDGVEAVYSFYKWP
jgi:hypothetical protein